MPKFKRVSVAIALIVFLISTVGLKPKYGPEGKPIAVPLSQSNEYFRDSKNSSPQFWSLISFYVPQLAGGTCSIATLIMTLNSAMGRLSRTQETKVITEKMMIDEIKKENWTDLILKELHQKMYWATLDQYRLLTEKAFKHHGFEKVKVEAIHVNDKSEETKKKVTAILTEFSQSKNHFILAGFDQKSFTDDTQVGHYAPVGAYDSSKKKVLILDPDREYFEPYWVSLDDFIAGMNTLDRSANQNRGLLWVTL